MVSLICGGGGTLTARCRAVRSTDVSRLAEMATRLRGDGPSFMEANAASSGGREVHVVGEKSSSIVAATAANLSAFVSTFPNVPSAVSVAPGFGC